MKDSDVVVTIKGADRQVVMYFSDTDEGDLNMEMAINPEPKDEEQPDLPLMLAHTFIKALREDDKSKVYDGQN